jgi:hypothetical protein
MMDAFEVLVTELDSKVLQLKEWMASGNAQSYDSYQKICGEIQGLLFAKQYALDLKHRMEHSDDE